jgi:NADPH2:quinone reductase
MESKADLARAAGVDHVIVDSRSHFADEVLRITDGEGVNVVTTVLDRTRSWGH